jgi:hypothetical protein
MVAKFTVDTSEATRLLNNLKTLRDPKRINRMVARDVIPPVERRLDAVLSTPAPARTAVKFIWSVDPAAHRRAQGWWFANLREGNIPADGAHYLRSNTIVKSWQTAIALVGNGVNVSLVNTAPGSEFVYGSRTQRQVPGHATTGWRNIKETARQFNEAMLVELREAYALEVARAARGK